MAAELDLVLRARRAIIEGAERSVCVGVAAGRVASLTAYDEPAAGPIVTLDDDEVLIPGLVDTHVHVN